MSEFVVHPIGRVESLLTDLADAPRQGDEVPLVTVLAVEGLRVQVDHLEAVDGTPLVDVKPVLGDIDER
ncbi:hypothetical protein BWI15_21610 [Kribbella sp. ALI-6-A]|uniref:TrmO family methyltransferase n=1 Tax=Kribbella sp. ALI-6-A TaxID=1933817 RepID=UPI00097C9BAB|nr:TrmO family methyltransferase [Kribbella sp. ALI-6-A]ONI69216.1 hypothetical protein BWI15_21610 [Kribbella sp. ALI-6-A]